MPYCPLGSTSSHFIADAQRSQLDIRFKFIESTYNRLKFNNLREYMGHNYNNRGIPINPMEEEELHSISRVKGVFWKNQQVIEGGMRINNLNRQNLWSHSGNIHYKNLLAYYCANEHQSARDGYEFDRDLANREIKIGEFYSYDLVMGEKWLCNGFVYIKVFGYTKKLGYMKSKTTSRHISSIMRTAEHFNIPLYIIRARGFAYANVSNNENCAICLEPHPHKIELTCGHSFHKKCIMNWLKTHNTCPLCRAPVGGIILNPEQPHLSIEGITGMNTVIQF